MVYRNHKRYLFGVILLAVSIFGTFLQVSAPNIGKISNTDPEEPFESAGWLSGWQYRKAHEIDGAAGTGTNYQVKIVVHYGSGNDFGKDVYLDSQCQADFGDIRFTGEDGATQLDYWMESRVANYEAVFWVEVADSLDSDRQVYVYYGTSQVSTTTSNGDATFLFFEDFEGNLDKWEVVDQDIFGDVWEISSSPGGREGHSGRYYEGGSENTEVMVVLPDQPWIKTTNVAVDWYCYYAKRELKLRFDVRDITDGNPCFVTHAKTPDFDWMYHDGDGHEFSDGFGQPADIWTSNTHWCFDSGNSDIEVDGTRHSGANRRSIGGGFNDLCFYGHGDWQDEFYLDDIRVRKINSEGNQPDHSSWSNEQTTSTSSVTSQTSSTTTSSSVANDDQTSLQTPFVVIGGISILVIAIGAAVFQRRKSHTILGTGETDTPSHPPNTKKVRDPPRDPQSREELILGALKSYPRIGINELSDMTGVDKMEVRDTILRLIANDRVSGTFDRSTDEFVSVDATRTGREIKSETMGPEGLPRCPYCGAPLEKTLGVGETGVCPSCGQKLMG
jgi:hypothetical protein